MLKLQVSPSLASSLRDRLTSREVDYTNFYSDPVPLNWVPEARAEQRDVELAAAVEAGVGGAVDERGHGGLDGGLAAQPGGQRRVRAEEGVRLPPLVLAQEAVSLAELVLQGADLKRDQHDSMS